MTTTESGAHSEGTDGSATADVAGPDVASGAHDRADDDGERVDRGADAGPDASGQDDAGDADDAGNPDDRPGSGLAGLGGPWWQPRLVWTLTLGIGGGFLLATFSGAVISRIRPLLVSLVVALFISFALEPAVKWMSDRGLSRGAATGLVFLVGTIAFVGFFAAMVPLIVSQVTTLVEAGPDLVNGLARQAQSLPGDFGQRVAEWLSGLRQDLPSRLPDMAGSASRGVLNVGASVVGTIFNVLTIALVAFYLAADGPKLRRVLSSNMHPSSQREFLEVWEVAVEKTGGYLYSRVLTAIVSAVFHTVVFLLIGLDYAFALGAWVGVVSSVVPVVGTYLAGVLPVAIALAASIGDAVWVLVAVVVYQQVENYLVVPRITGQTVSLHPAVAFVSVLAGAALLGAVGALLAIPTAAIIAALWSTRRDRHEVVDHTLTAHHEPRRRRRGQE